MIKFNLTYEGKKTAGSVQREFANRLSEKEILKTTAFALNTTARRSQGFVKREVKKDYTTSNKYLDRMSKLSKPASGKQGGLYAEVSYSFKPVPMIGFRHKQNGKRSGVSVEIKKGKSILMKHSFIATMKSGHQGIFSSGSYVSGKFRPAYSRTSNKKTRITEMRTASPLTMATSKGLQPRIIKYIGQSLPSRLRAMLQRKVDQVTK